VDKESQGEHRFRGHVTILLDPPSASLPPPSVPPTPHPITRADVRPIDRDREMREPDNRKGTLFLSPCICTNGREITPPYEGRERPFNHLLRRRFNLFPLGNGAAVTRDSICRRHRTGGYERVLHLDELSSSKNDTRHHIYITWSWGELSQRH
jgi:hypothetical protein